MTSPPVQIGNWVAKNKAKRALIDFVSYYGECRSAPIMLSISQWDIAYKSWLKLNDRKMQGLENEKNKTPLLKAETTKGKV